MSRTAWLVWGCPKPHVETIRTKAVNWLHRSGKSEEVMLLPEKENLERLGARRMPDRLR
jgi:hypothetical protein